MSMTCNMSLVIGLLLYWCTGEICDIQIIQWWQWWDPQNGMCGIISPRSWVNLAYHTLYSNQETWFKTQGCYKIFIGILRVLSNVTRDLIDHREVLFWFINYYELVLNSSRATLSLAGQNPGVRMWRKRGWGWGIEPGTTCVLGETQQRHAIAIVLVATSQVFTAN